MTVEENGGYWCKAIEVGTMNLLRQFKIENSGRRFLAWKDGLYYSMKDEAQFKHVLRGNVLKGLDNYTISKQMQISSLFQISEARLYVRAPAVWRHWQKAYLDTKINN